MSEQTRITIELINLMPLINAFTNTQKEVQHYFNFMYGKEDEWTNEQIAEYLSIMKPLLKAEAMVLDLKDKLYQKTD